MWLETVLKFFIICHCTESHYAVGNGYLRCGLLFTFFPCALFILNQLPWYEYFMPLLVQLRSLPPVSESFELPIPNGIDSIPVNNFSNLFSHNYCFKCVRMRLKFILRPIVNGRGYHSQLSTSHNLSWIQGVAFKLNVLSREVVRTLI